MGDICISRREAESILCGSNLRSIGHMTPRVSMNEVQYKTLILLETLWDLNNYCYYLYGPWHVYGGRRTAVEQVLSFDIGFLGPSCWLWRSTSGPQICMVMPLPQPLMAHNRRVYCSFFVPQLCGFQCELCRWWCWSIKVASRCLLCTYSWHGGLSREQNSLL